MFSTSPLAFGAPARRNPALMSDIAASTTSIGKVNLAWLAGEPIPAGRARVIIYDTGEGGLKPPGGTTEMSARKGSGICTMTEVFSALLGGATTAPLQTARAPGSDGTDTDHVFKALNPDALRPLEEFHDDMDQLIDALRTAPSADPERPVIVPGDLEWKTRRARRWAGFARSPARFL